MATRSTPEEDVDTVARACAFGALGKLSAFVQEDPSSVNTPDAQGYSPLQWAALNNRVQEASFLLAHGAHVNATDHTGQTALHWAAVRGSLPVLEVLLRAGADHELRDSRGYTVAHVAAQYGQCAVLYHLALKWSVDIDSPDLDGRTPLHWAAYKGVADAVRLLLVLDCRCTQPDREGCTPLHWAAIKGNGEACTVLLQGGGLSSLTHKDVTGATPAQLALEKGHRYLGMHLAEYKDKHTDSNNWCGGRNKWLTSTQLCPIIWFIGLLLMALYCYKVMSPSMHPVTRCLSWMILGSATLGFVCLYKTTTTDPGYLPRGWETSSSGKGRGGSNNSSREGDEWLHRRPLCGPNRGLDSPALWAGNWHQLCVSCRIVRPLRAKHCSVSDRCIETFDHYCPWVGNAIGKGNRHWFLMFLWLMLFAHGTSAVIGVIQIKNVLSHSNFSTGNLVWMISFEVLDVFVGISVAALAAAQASQIARGITTNELANWHRYKYLQGPNGFHNPFSKGVWTNCWEAFHPRRVPTAPVYLPTPQTV